MKLGKLPALPWYLRLVAFLAIGGVLYAGFWYFVTSGTRKETKAMEDEIAQLRPRNAQAAIVQQNLNNFKAAYKAREEEFAELKALLPEQRELTMVLQGIQDRAKTAMASYSRASIRRKMCNRTITAARRSKSTWSAVSPAASFLRTVGPLSADRFDHQFRIEATGKAVAYEDC